MKLSRAPFTGDPSGYTDEQWAAACVLDKGEGQGAKERFAVPVREADGTRNVHALAKAAEDLHGAGTGEQAIAQANARLAKHYLKAGLPVGLGAAGRVQQVVPLLKAAQDARQIVYGVVLTPGLRDSQGDILDAQEIEKAAHRWLAEVRKQDVQHDEGAYDVVPVESFIAPADMEIAGQPVLKGSWVLACHVRDAATWQRVAKDEITGFSIGGSGLRLPDEPALAA